MAEQKKSPRKRTPRKKSDPEFKTAAALIKTRLGEGKATKEEIEEEVRISFPGYKALAYAVGVYRRELRKKGLLPKEGD